MADRILTVTISAGVLAALGLSGWASYRAVEMRKEIADLKWKQAYFILDQADTISPEVGTIQFIRKDTLSISLSEVNYNSDGLHLRGEVGNSSNIWITNLTLNFSAEKPLNAQEADFKKKGGDIYGDWVIIDVPPIGKAQSKTIQALAPAMHAEFDVTIPNVKQEKDGIRILVNISGERYSYVP